MTTHFSINGKSHVVDLTKLPSDITLNTFIRDHAGLSATKFMCQEGGCGVCVAVMRGKHPITGEFKTWAVNTCLTLLNTCADREIITSEGFGNKRTGYHAIQERLAKMNGTQCGYCSPGFVMNMYGLLASKGGNVTMAEVEDAFGGNLCRCTGYRSILDAMKSFATDSNIPIPTECQNMDIEDLIGKTCPRTGENCAGTCKNGNTKLTSLMSQDGCEWFWPSNISEVFKAFAAMKSDKYILVAGNTGHGVYRRSADIKSFIDISGVTGIQKCDISAKQIYLGGGLSLTATMEALHKASQKAGFEYCQKVWDHFNLIANVPVRNAGTLAGSMTLKHDHPEFPNDVFVLFEALDVRMTILESVNKEITVSMSEYLKTSMNKKLIIGFTLRPYPATQFLFDSYKIMTRAQNTHALVNAAFLIERNPLTNVVSSARICFGAINPKLTRVENFEKHLVGRNLFDDQGLTKTIALLHSELNPDAILPDPSPEHRRKLAVNLFYKFLLAHAPQGVIHKSLISGGERLVRPVSSGKQTYDEPPANTHVHQALDKIEGVLQTAGETTYANDLPPQPNQVWVAYVTAKVIGATVVGFDESEALKLPGVVGFFTAKDIPGRNSVTTADTMFFPEQLPLFTTGPIKFFNAPVAIVVADSNELAQRAAALVKVKYSDGGRKVLPSLKAVLSNASASERIHHAIKSPIKELKLSEPYDFHSKGKLDMGAQYHFFLEPHATVAVPKEDGLYIHSSTQWMDFVQIIVAEFLGLKHNKVQVRVRRIGGGYGGKATASGNAACAAALAAYHLNRPARFVQTLESMMTTLGKRWPFVCDYEFYAKKDGRIVGIRNIFHHDAGCSLNESPSEHALLLSKNCYMFSDNYKLDGYKVLTDTPSNMACRAPGSVEGIAMIENIIEHIAFVTNLDPADVRLINLIPGHKMGEMFPQFLVSSEYKKRKQAVANYNKENRWRKRGLGLAVMEYHIGYFGQFPATVAIYRGDGTVIISHGGIEMGQGMNTKITQVAAQELGLPTDMVRIERSDTLNGANSMVTGGSIGSETVCYAVRKCCNTLNERLQEVRAEMKGAPWPEIIAAAYNRKINLIASDDCKAGEMEPYTVCALCLTDVEVDLLTGNYLLSRVDILEDTGISLNPRVDIGQIEGAYMMGLGYWTTEELVTDSMTGELLTNRSWNYKPPGPKDIPIDFRIEFLSKSENSAGFMRSKATGEPAICLSVAVAFALQEALQSARNDAGLPKKWITLAAPMTPEYVLMNAGIEPALLQLK